MGGGEEAAGWAAGSQKVSVSTLIQVPNAAKVWGVPMAGTGLAHTLDGQREAAAGIPRLVGRVRDRVRPGGCEKRPQT